jgi:hypothetical protein
MFFEVAQVAPRAVGGGWACVSSLCHRFYSTIAALNSDLHLFLLIFASMNI